MSLNELLEKTTIKFPRPINREEAEKLLFYIAKNLPANVSTTIEYYKSYYHINKDITETNGTLKVNADIDSVRKRGLFDSFESVSDEIGSSYISAIAFQKVPGWELSEYRPEKIKLWDDVRKVINKYFKEVSQEKDSKEK